MSLITAILGEKCFLGNERIKGYQTTKYYRAADGTWKVCCAGHYRKAGLDNRRINPDKRRKIQ